MVTFFQPFRFAFAILPILAAFSVCDARVLPKVKRDNSTCCGYTITNRNNVYFKNKFEMDFSTVRLPANARRLSPLMLSILHS
jgi:hypothetical protein